MADTKITALTAIGANPIIPSTFPIPMVDLTDTSMAASGTTKKVTVNQILQAGGIATLASATITGDLTVDTSTLKVDSTNNRVGIGTASPAYTLDVFQSGAATIASSFAMARFSGSNAVANDFTLVGPNTSQVRLNFSDPDLNGVGEIGYDHSTNRMRFVANGNEQYRIDPSGVFTWLDGAGGTRMTLNSTGLGIGVTPSAWATAGGYRALQIGGVGIYGRNTASNELVLSSNAYFDTTDSRWEYITTAAATRYDQQYGAHQWFNAASGTLNTAITFTQAMTLDASGFLRLAASNASSAGSYWLQVKNTGASSNSVWFENLSGNDRGIIVCKHDQATGASSGTMMVFQNGGGSTVGSIVSTNTATAYNISSDYRLKESVTPLSGGLARVNALKPSNYKWKADGSSGEGFLAHELAEVVPAAVSGEKDAVNEDGSIKAQGVDLSKVVPILVSAIQELTARVQTLEAK